MYSGYDLITMAPGEVKIEAMPPPHKAGRARIRGFTSRPRRQFLAWVRTSLALMGFGFPIARFGLLLRETEALDRVPAVDQPGATTFSRG